MKRKLVAWLAVVLTVAGAAPAEAARQRQASDGGAAQLQAGQVAVKTGSTRAVSMNLHVPVRVLSPGNGGAVRQSHARGSGSATGSPAAERQAAAGGAAHVQAGQVAVTTGAVEPASVNASAPVRLLSPGREGSTEQRNGDGNAPDAGESPPGQEGPRPSEATGDATGPAGSAGGVLGISARAEGPPVGGRTSSPGEPRGGTGTLPFTGSRARLFAVLGALMVAGGAALQLVARRRTWQ